MFPINTPGWQLELRLFISWREEDKTRVLFASSSLATTVWQPPWQPPGQYWRWSWPQCVCGPVPVVKRQTRQKCFFFAALWIGTVDLVVAVLWGAVTFPNPCSSLLVRFLIINKQSGRGGSIMLVFPGDWFCRFDGRLLCSSARP